MKFFRLDLLTLLISLFILNSCKNQDAVGLAGSTTGQLSGTLVDTSTIYTNTVLDDTVATSASAGLGTTKSPLGFFNDPIFGLTESNLATDIGLPASYSPPSGTVAIDSALLVLQYADGFYGDSVASNYKVNVYQLSERYISNTTYYNDKQWKYDPNNLLGSVTFKARTHDSVKIYNIITGKPDTLIKSAPQIRVPINKNFVSSILFNASSTTLGSQTIYQNLVKGMYLTLDKTQTTGPGGILMIKSDTLTVYYRNINGSKIDTLSTKIPVSSFAAQIKHTYPAAIQTELANTSSSRNTIYLQGLAGLRAKISFPNLLLNLRKNLLNKDSDIVINRAEVVVTPQPGTDIPYRPSPKLTMYRLDIAHQRAYVEDANTAGDARSFGVGVFGGFYISTKKQYRFVVTAYLQDLLQNRTIDYGTYISPADTTNKSSVDILSPQIVTATARTVAGGGADKTSPYRIKLNIIYTKVRK